MAKVPTKAASRPQQRVVFAYQAKIPVSHDEDRYTPDHAALFPSTEYVGEFLRPDNFAREAGPSFAAELSIAAVNWRKSRRRRVS